MNLNCEQYLLLGLPVFPLLNDSMSDIDIEEFLRATRKEDLHTVACNPFMAADANNTNQKRRLFDYIVAGQKCVSGIVLAVRDTPKLIQSCSVPAERWCLA